MVNSAITADVPGTTVFHIPASTGQFVGSPGIAILPNGLYVSKCDLFGPQSSERENGLTKVFVSSDQGQTWSHQSDVQDMYWASIFTHGDSLYLLGTAKEYGHVSIARSDDSGQNWTQPSILRQGSFHCAPMPVIVHGGQLWRAFEQREPASGWAENLRAFVMAAPLDSDLLNSLSWTSTTALPSDNRWNGGDFRGWLEGNVVVTREGEMVNVLRVAVEGQNDKAAIVHVNRSKMQTTFDPVNDLVNFPGGATKFTIRYEVITDRYWSLANAVAPAYEGNPLTFTRNTLALISSTDLREWTVQSVILFHEDREHHGFQYADWLFEGEDIIFASRTAYEDEFGIARNQHDANYLTFHRITKFRNRSLSDSALNDRLIIGQHILEAV